VWCAGATDLGLTWSWDQADDGISQPGNQTTASCQGAAWVGGSADRPEWRPSRAFPSQPVATPRRELGGPL
jgi:hypothetical protein